jgi:predicted permease
VPAVLSILLSDILPIFVIAAMGYLIEHRLSGSGRVLSFLSFNVLSPCLIFNLLVTAKLSGGAAGRMAAFCILLTASMGVAAYFASRSLGLGGKTRTGFLLTVMFSNSGNYALPVILFAFGREALSFASVYFVTSAIVVYTAGVFIAAHDGRSLGRTLMGIRRVPALYALGAAFLVVVANLDVPKLLMRPVSMLSDAAIPLMIVALGMQLQRVRIPERPAPVVIAAALSLLVAPMAGAALASLLGIEGIARSASIVIAAMPAAAVTTVLAVEFDLDTSFVASVVFLSTLVSPLTLSLLINYLKS